MGTSTADSIELSELRISSIANRRGSVGQSGSSFTTAAAALAAAVYRNDSLCLPAGHHSESGGSFVAYRTSTAGVGGSSDGAAANSALPSRLMSMAPGAVGVEAAGTGAAQQHVDIASQGALASRRLSRVEASMTGPSVQKGADNVSAPAARRYSWADTGRYSGVETAAGALQRLRSHNWQQQQKWAPAGLYGVLQEVQHVAPSSPGSPDRYLLAPRVSLQEAAVLQPSSQQQQQQEVRSLPQQPQVGGAADVRAQNATTGATQVRLAPPPRVQQQQQQQPQTQLPVLHVKTQPPPPLQQQQGSPVPPQPDSPYRNSPTSSSAFASAASVCWEQPAQQPLEELEGLHHSTNSLSRNCAPRVVSDTPTAAVAAAAATAGAGAVSVNAPAAALKPLGSGSRGVAGTGSNDGAMVRTSSPSQHLHQQQSQRLLLQQRSLQECSSAPVRLDSSASRTGVPRQLSLPSYGSVSGTTVAPAAGGPAPAGGGGGGALLSSQSGGAFATQRSLLSYGVQAAGEVLTGALPLEALPALRVGKLHRHQSFMLQAIKDQVSLQKPCKVAQTVKCVPG